MRRATWTPGIWFLAESCHLGWGAFVCFITFHYALPWWVFLIETGVAAVKEFIVDPLWEKDTLGDGAIDFAFYELGIPVAALAFWAVPIWLWFLALWR
jgi:hypothetical protein